MTMARHEARAAASTRCWRARRWCSCSARAASARRRWPRRSALAAAVDQGGRVLVLTVDPARRLADALGVGALGNVAATRCPTQRSRPPASTPRGELWAAMLDTKAGWDDLIRRHAPDAKVRDAVLANPLYQNITSRFVHSHDYIAMERLHELHASGEYDLVVVDTPPSRNALDVLDAPARMTRVLRQPAAALAHRAVPVAAVHGRVEALLPGGRSGARLSGFLQDIAEFFVLFQAMEKGFVARAREVEALLGDAAHDVRRRLDAGDGAGARGRVPRPRAARRATTTSARSSPTGCCRRR